MGDHSLNGHEGILLTGSIGDTQALDTPHAQVGVEHRVSGARSCTSSRRGVPDGHEVVATGMIHRTRSSAPKRVRVFAALHLHMVENSRIIRNVETRIELLIVCPGRLHGVGSKELASLLEPVHGEPLVDRIGEPAHVDVGQVVRVGGLERHAAFGLRRDNGGEDSGKLPGPNTGDTGATETEIVDEQGRKVADVSRCAEELVRGPVTRVGLNH